VTSDYAGRTEPYRGHEGIRQYFRDVAMVWDDLRLTPREFREVGDCILVTGRVSARSLARIVDGSTGWVWRVRDGRVVYGRVYASASDAEQAVMGDGAR
jgi:ketosteroid isomerase-like protein